MQSGPQPDLDQSKVEALTQKLDALTAEPTIDPLEQDPSVPAHWWARAVEREVQGEKRMVYTKKCIGVLEAPISQFATQLEEVIDGPEGWKLLGTPISIPRRPNKTTGHASLAVVLVRDEHIVLPPTKPVETPAAVEDVAEKAAGWEAEGQAPPEA